MRRVPLHTRILIGMVAGAALGLAANGLFGGTAGLEMFISGVTYPAGQIFLRLIFMVVIPLVVSALILGVAELGDPRRLGRVGLKTLLFTVLLSAASVLIGVGLANLIRPGEGLSEEARSALVGVMQKHAGEMKEPPHGKTGLRVFLDLIPENPLEAAVNAFRGDMIAVMVFALVFGVALTLLPRPSVQPLLTWLQALFDVVMKVIDLAMLLAPYGVAALLFTMTARSGWEVLWKLALYAATVLAGLLLHQFGTYALVVRRFAGLSPGAFFRRIEDVMATAFTTSSSNATLPTTLRVAEEEIGIPRSIGSFVLTLGSTLNQNGSALFEGVTVLFLAQFFGVHLTIGQQVTVVLLSIASGIGTAGVPGGSLPMVAALLVTVGVPAAGIGIILGIDRLLDMSRTVVNVTGDLAVAACVARGEGHILKR